MALPSMQSCGVTVVFCFCLLSTGAVAEILPSILWNSENPLFQRLGDTPRKVMPFDTMSILCPNLVEYPIKREILYSKDLLYENVFMVDKQGYESCNATSGLKILLCNDPVELGKHTTIVFQPNSANANDPKFKQGEEYYFINTASGLMDSLSSLEGGRCKDGQMKMKIYVCKQNNDPKCQHGNKVVHGGWSDWSKCIEGSLQSRQCNNPFPENGGLPCYGEHERHCSTNASQTLGCKGSSCSTVANEKTTTASPSGLAAYLTLAVCTPALILKNVKEMQSIQELSSLVFACTVAMIIFHLLCYLMEKIKNVAVNVIELVSRLKNQGQQVAEPTIRRRPEAVEHEWIG